MDSDRGKQEVEVNIGRRKIANRGKKTGGGKLKVYKGGKRHQMEVKTGIGKEQR